MTAIQNTPGLLLGKCNARVAEPPVPIVAAQSVRRTQLKIHCAGSRTAIAMTASDQLATQR
jgi:hypothetical protein